MNAADYIQEAFSAVVVAAHTGIITHRGAHGHGPRDVAYPCHCTSFYSAAFPLRDTTRARGVRVPVLYDRVASSAKTRTRDFTSGLRGFLRKLIAFLWIYAQRSVSLAVLYIGYFI